MKTLLIGIGAAGNKAVAKAVQNQTVEVDDTAIINSTEKDFPKDYEGKSKLVLTPDSAGCGKERKIARDYALTAIKSGKLNLENVNKYTTIIIVTSVEGGTGSGATPVIAKFFSQVYRKNVHVIAFAGFEDDVRGLSNTLEFFQEIDSNIVVQIISNKAFMEEANNNRFIAEQMANDEMTRRIEILTGKNFIASDQNIDDTDLNKISNTSGYMTCERINLSKPLVDQEMFNKMVKQMIYNSKSLKSRNPGAARIGVILNISPESEGAIDYSFTDLKAFYGNPYECFYQKQWDGKKEYIDVIISGMTLPIDEMKEVHERYKEQTSKVNKEADSFFSEMAKLSADESDSRFDMIKPAQKGIDVEDFMKQFETK